MTTHNLILGLAHQSNHVRQCSKSQQKILISGSRGVHDIVHKVAAVGSRTIEKAQEFIDKCAQGDQSIKAYGTYGEVYADEVNPFTE